MIYFHYATVENALLLANVKEYSTAISKLISLKRLCCSFNVITIYIFFFSQKAAGVLDNVALGKFHNANYPLKESKEIKVLVSPFIP